MSRVHLVVSHDADARARAEILRRAGFEVDTTRLTPQAVRAFRRPPEAFVFDLSRAPSLGRDMALFIRQVPATRRIPLVFVGGEAAKVAAIRRVLPDASYIEEWSRVGAGVRRAIAHPPRDPVVPGVFAPFAGVPVAQKLGIKTGSVVALVGPPRDLDRILGTLPAGTQLRRGVRGKADLTLWFVREREGLEDGIARMKPAAERGGLWILWPKRSNGASEVNQVVVRKAGLANGLVDFKITSVSAQWSGLRFTRRKAR